MPHSRARVPSIPGAICWVALRSLVVLGLVGLCGGCQFLQNEFFIFDGAAPAAPRRSPDADPHP